MSRHYPRYAKEESDAELHRNVRQSASETLLMPLHLRRKENVDHIDDGVNCYCRAYHRRENPDPIKRIGGSENKQKRGSHYRQTRDDQDDGARYDVHEEAA